jgi:predicted MFS family arabinose efflux permease
VDPKVEMGQAATGVPVRGGPGPWRATLAGLCASLVGVGLARFAYTPLIPALIAHGWFSPAQAAYLGAANLAGYLAGALLARPLAARAPVEWLLRTMMLLATAAFFACAAPLSFAWFFVWRFAAGLAGAALIVLAAPAILPHVPTSRRGLASGAIFTGVGLGVAASGTLVPLLLRAGDLTRTWFGLGALSLLLTAVAWRGWPADGTPAKQSRSTDTSESSSGPELRALFAEYGLCAAGLVPHMVFLVDFVARGLGQGLTAGASYWVVYGLGAAVGPVLGGRLADRIGFGATLRLAYLTQAIAVALPALTVSAPALIASSFLVGALTPGIVPLVLGRIHELMPGDEPRQRTAWSTATIVFALLQAAGGYGFSFLFAHREGGYTLLFALGSAAFVLALAADATVTLARRQAQ